MTEIQIDYEKHNKEMEKKISNFAEDIRKAAVNALGDFECDFMPHLEFDYMSNVKMQSERCIDNMLLGRETGLYKLSSHQAKELRKKIYEENKEEIIKAVGKDFEDEIYLLKMRLDFELNTPR